jgi:hypothetical protein
MGLNISSSRRNGKAKIQIRKITKIMKGKIEELEEIRAELENLTPANENFDKKLLQLLNRTTSQLSPVDDQQEINWAAKSFDIVRQLQDGQTEEDPEKEKDLALTYLKEVLDSVIIREKQYLK